MLRFHRPAAAPRGALWLIRPGGLRERLQRLEHRCADLAGRLEGAEARAAEAVTQAQAAHQLLSALAGTGADLTRAAGEGPPLAGWRTEVHRLKDEGRGPGPAERDGRRVLGDEWGLENEEGPVMGDEW